MEISNKLKAILVNMHSLYQGSLQRLIDQIIQIYNDYPYLLIILLALVPIVLTFLIWAFEKTVFFILKKRKKKKNAKKNVYFKKYLNLIIWYFSHAIFNKFYLSLNKDFEVYEKFIFSIAISLSAALIIVSVIKIFAQNAYDQFQSVLKSKSNELRENLKTIKIYTIFYISFCLILKNHLEWQSLSFWIFLFSLVHITKMFSKLDTSNKEVMTYLFGELSLSLKKIFFGPLRIVSFFIILIFAFIYRIVFALSYFELTKKIAAKIIRQQVERVSQTEEKECFVPDYYKDLFSQISFEQFRPPWFEEIFNQMLATISEWETDSINESFVHLVGDQGTGRALLIQDIISKNEHLNPLVIEVPGKIFDKEEFIRFISNCVENIEKEESLQKVANKLIIFSNAENLFLNSPGGFDALKEMFRIVNRSENNFFWINVFDYHPWQHIQDFFGHVHHRQKFTVKNFSDKELKTLIETKSRSLGVKIVFEKAIYEATSKKGLGNQEDNVSIHFFRMLWEQSNGNLKMAQDLWLKSIKNFNEKEKKIRIGLPARNNLSVLKDLNMDSLFVYNALVRHSRLNFDDCCKVTNLSARIVRFALVFGENEKFLVRDDNNNFIIVRSWYATINQLLKTKNLIYG